MKSTKKVFLSIVSLLAAGVTQAHHSAIVFDGTKTIEVTGEVSEFIYRNPHLIIGLDVADDSGNTVLWKIEGQSVAMLRRVGFDRTTVKVGDNVTVKINPMKAGNPGGLLQGLVAADGIAYSMDDSAEPSPEATRDRLEAPSLVEFVPPPEGETWQIREEKTRPDYLPIVSEGLSPGDSTSTGITMGALDPENLSLERPAAGFDLTGVWQFRGEDEWRANYGSYEFKPSPELSDSAQAYFDQYIDASRKGERFGDPAAECYPAGMPRLMTRYGSLMMMQYPTAIFMMSRLNNEYRVIYTDGRERVSENNLDRNWGGESLGHWEGDTLVVETKGFIGENKMAQAGIRTSEKLEIIERITMVNDGNTLVSEYTLTDPENWVGEWNHVKFRDRVLRSDVKEANCIPKDNLSLPGIGG
jgi:hypothetical protein